MQISKLIKTYGKLYSAELGINLKTGKENEIFKWFLASILFGKRIGENIAANTYREFVKAGIITPKAILKAGWDKLVKILDDGGYVRYDFSTAIRLLEISKKLLIDYKGKVTNIHEKAVDAKDLEKRLEEFKGIGPITVNIFLRELRHIWKKADPELLAIVRKVAKKFKIKLPAERKTKSFIKLEAALIRLRKKCL